jgi:hypothetical protein
VIENQNIGLLQDQLLGLALFDTNACARVRGSFEPKDMLSPEHRELLSRAYRFYERFGVSARGHASTWILRSSDSPDASALYVEMLYRAQNLYLGGINTDYVLGEWGKVLDRARWDITHEKMGEILDGGDTEQIAPLVLDALSQRRSVDRGGINLGEGFKKAFAPDEECEFSSGLTYLDGFSIVPKRGKLFLIEAFVNVGKSFFMTYLANQAILHGKRVAYLSLEMSEAQIDRRLIQGHFGPFYYDPDRDSPCGSTRDIANPVVQRTSNHLTHSGPLLAWTSRSVPTTRDPDFLAALELTVLNSNANKLIHIKGFPSVSLSFEGYDEYLSDLIYSRKFVPDLVCLDYPDEMKLPRSDNHRFDLDNVFRQLRGHAQKHNYALVTASQVNRDSERTGHIGLASVAESVGKVAIADMVVSLVATKDEKKLGILRVTVEKNRDGKKPPHEIAIVQDLSVGCFYTSEFLVPDRYEERIRETLNAYEVWSER